MQAVNITSSGALLIGALQDYLVLCWMHSFYALLDALLFDALLDALLFDALLVSAWCLLGCSVGVTSAGATVVRWRLVIWCSLQTPAASSAPAPPDGPLHVASESRNGSNGSNGSSQCCFGEP